MSEKKYLIVEIDDNTPLKDLQQYVIERLEEGTTCPVCTQNAQTYKRSIYKSMVESLIGLYKNGGLKKFVHWSNYRQASGSGDFAKLRYWDLIEESPERREDNGKAGLWKITEKGHKFLNNEISVPKYAFIFDAELFDMGGDQITVEDALGEHFDLRDIVID